MAGFPSTREEDCTILIFVLRQIGHVLSKTLAIDSLLDVRQDLKASCISPKGVTPFCR